MQFLGHAVVVKRDERLHIFVEETGQTLYTPPDFLKFHTDSRQDLQGLADHFTACQNRSLIAIMYFERERRP